jgi:outer membrane protein
MTRKLIRFILPVALLAVSAFAQNGTATVPAPQTGANKIGIINIQEAILASNEGQRDLNALQKKFEPTQNELNALNKEIDSLKTQLQTQGDKMNEEARNSLVKNIENKQKTLQRRAEDAQSDFQSQQGEVANRIGVKIMEVVDKYAKQNGYTMVLDVSSPQSPVLWALPNTNVTKDIVDAYNARSGVAAPVGATGQAATPPSAPRPQTSPRPAGSTTAPRPTTPKQ